MTVGGAGGGLAGRSLFNACARRGAQKKLSVFANGEFGWIRLCLEMEENICLTLWVKLGCSPRCTQIVPKWHLDGPCAALLPEGAGVWEASGHRGSGTAHRSTLHTGPTPLDRGAGGGGAKADRAGGRGMEGVVIQPRGPPSEGVPPRRPMRCLPPRYRPRHNSSMAPPEPRGWTSESAHHLSARVTGRYSAEPKVKSVASGGALDSMDCRSSEMPSTSAGN